MSKQFTIPEIEAMLAETTPGFLDAECQRNPLVERNRQLEYRLAERVGVIDDFIVRTGGNVNDGMELNIQRVNTLAQRIKDAMVTKVRDSASSQRSFTFWQAFATTYGQDIDTLERGFQVAIGITVAALEAITFPEQNQASEKVETRA